MRSIVHDTPLQLKVSHQLMADIRAGASRKGMSLSELVRHAIRRELEAAASAPVSDDRPRRSRISANGALGPATANIVAKAARGDMASQQWLFEDRMAAFSHHEGNSPEALAIATEAVLFARLLAGHGHSQDIQRLAGALCQAAETLRLQGRPEVSDFLMAETISLLEQLAEDGNDLAAVCSHALIGREAPGLPDAVRALRAKISQTETVA